jgi:four helix bundle protein
MEARSARFAKEIAEFATKLRQRPGGQKSANQLADCSSSAAANYRAAGRARSRKEFLSKLGIANEEADESVYWLEHIAGTALGNGFNLKSLEREARELRAIIARSYATAKRRNSGKK